MHLDLVLAIDLLYKPHNLFLKNFVKEEESSEYEAATFEINNLKIKFRMGKITPTKSGQFVTLWKRIDQGPIQPFDLDDPFDLLIVHVRSTERLGQFIFPKKVLFENGVISKDGKGGKRAMRIYPPWNIADNKQAKKTQSWQLEYFIEIPMSKNTEVEKLKQLFD